MKRMITVLVCLLLLSGCGNPEREIENRINEEVEKAEIYHAGYKDGYIDAMEWVAGTMPEYVIDMEELEDSLYMIFEDAEYAEEIRDWIWSDCVVYERGDFTKEFSDSGIDFDY